MGTRAVITFKDESGSFSVYQHWDGDPDTVLANIGKLSGVAWELPRFEADEAAAAYVACFKTGPGNIRLLNGLRSWLKVDAQYRYMVTKGTKPNTVRVGVYEMVCADGELRMVREVTY